MSRMLKSSGAMGLATMVSRVLGLVRDQVYAAFMGTSAVAGAFQLAFTIPNLFRRLLGEGALTAAFIPIFKEKEKNEGEIEMWRAANAVISGLIVSAAVAVGVVLLLISVVLSSLPLPDDLELMLRLLRIMFPYMLLVCLAAVFIGMLNSRGHFFIPALGAAMLNVVMISSVLFLAPKMGETLDKQIFALAIGVLVAGVAQAGFQVPLLYRDGFRHQWVSPWRNETVREVVRKMLPASVGVAAFQINVMLTQGLAFFGGASIVATYSYAVRLMELPQGVFGVSLAMFLLPALSGLAAEKNFVEFRATLRQGIGYLVFINALCTVLLLALSSPIIRLLFEYKEFDAFSTMRVGFALACLAPGLVAFSLANILARAFYALGDVKTPMRISILCMGVNILLVILFLFVFDLAAGGLGLASSFSSAVNVGLLFYALRRKLKTLELGELLRQLVPISIAALGAGLLAWAGSQIWESRLGHESVLLRLGAVFVPMTLATLLYFIVCWQANVPSALDIIGLLRRKLGDER